MGATFGKNNKKVEPPPPQTVLNVASSLSQNSFQLPPSFTEWMEKTRWITHAEWATSYAEALIAWVDSEEGKKNKHAQNFKMEIKFLGDFANMRKTWLEYGGNAAEITNDAVKLAKIQGLYKAMYEKYIKSEWVNLSSHKSFVGKDDNPTGWNLHFYNKKYNYVANNFMVPKSGSSDLVIVDPTDDKDIWHAACREVVDLFELNFGNPTTGSLKKGNILYDFHRSPQYQKWLANHGTDEKGSTAQQVFPNELRFSADDSLYVPLGARDNYVYGAIDHYRPGSSPYALPGTMAPPDPAVAVLPIVLVLLFCVCAAIFGFLACCAGTLTGYVSSKFVRIEMPQMPFKKPRYVDASADSQV